MSLTIASIQDAKNDDELFERLSSALEQNFPTEVRNNPDEFYSALLAAPTGLRAMAGIYDLDVSMSLDDLAWHFGNHNDERFLQETVRGLRELEADEAARLFLAAWDIVKPHLAEIKAKDWEGGEFHDFLDRTGIQAKIDPLNDDMWAICKACGKLGLMQYWLPYARKYPEKCVRVQ